MVDDEIKNAGVSPAPRRIHPTTEKSASTEGSGVENVNDKTFGFGEAMERILGDVKVRRLGWENDDYVFMKSSFVHIKRDDGIHQLLVSEGDITAIDWVEVKE